MATEASLPRLPPDDHAHTHDNANVDNDATPPRPAKRSWRRKYRKMRIRFDDAMSDSNTLILQEWKAMGTARRLQENNDQLLELLLDFNEQPRVNPRLRYDLRHLSAADTAVPSSEPGHTRHSHHGPDGPDAPDALSSLAALEAHVPHTGRANLASFLPQAPHYPIDGLDLSPHAPGYLSPAHEEEYLLATDAALEEPGFDPARQHGRPLRLASAHPPLAEKELTVRNPDSVYNWLRKHQPQVFLQDKDALALHAETLSEKSAHKTASGGGGGSGGGSKKAKRESTAARGGTATPGPGDPHDEPHDPAAYDMTAKARRKTGSGHHAAGDDDTAYRPKGGHSRPPKRKREDGDASGGGKSGAKKKSRPSAVGAGGTSG